ncbi:MAG: phosphotransferase [Pseudonocardiaceae bacterium]
MAIPRLGWEQLPDAVRHAVEALLGPVWSAKTVTHGQNSALATILDTQQGRVFVKGLRTGQRGVVSQQREAAINPHVRAVSPALLWRIEIAGWDLLCFEYVAGRGVDYTPGSADLPRLVSTMQRLAEVPCPNLPPAYFRPAEQRWAEPLDDPATRELLAGDTILHTDYNPANILVTSSGNVQIIDWAWPTKGAAWIDPANLVPRLIASGHSPASAEEVARGCPAWRDADPAAINLFASALTSLWADIARDQPDEGWKQTLAASTRQWLNHRLAAVIVTGRQEQCGAWFAECLPDEGHGTRC